MRRGAVSLENTQSILFLEAARVIKTFRRFTRNQASAVCECTIMSDDHMEAMSDAFETRPFVIDAKYFAPVLRRRLFWFVGDICWPKGSRQIEGGSIPEIAPPRRWEMKVVIKDCILPPWKPPDDSESFHFLCLTSRIPAKAPRRDTVDVNRASKDALARWREEEFSAPPYQFEDRNLLSHPSGKKRRLFSCEEERISGIPDDYTNAITKDPAQSLKHREFRRRTLIGNAVHVCVAAFVLQSSIAQALRYAKFWGGLVFRIAPRVGRFLPIL